MNNEDIKVLEEYVEEFNENKKKYKMVYSTGFGKYWTDFVQAIENLIKGYKELEEKQLKKSGIYEIGIDLDDDYIPKSKVRELIEKFRCFGWHDKDDEYWVNRILDALQELLEERN